MRHATGCVMVRQRFGDGRGQPPQTQQVSPDLRVGNTI
jgi:hypothetical protein